MYIGQVVGCVTEFMSADELDAKIYEFNEAAENTEPGTFSPKVFSLGNIQVYKPNI